MNDEGFPLEVTVSHTLIYAIWQKLYLPLVVICSYLDVSCAKRNDFKAFAYEVDVVALVCSSHQ
jgi:hypothetical protein